MKYIFFSFSGNCFPIAQHLLNEGKEVYVAQVYDEKKTLTELEKKNYENEGEFWKNRRLSLFSNMIEKISAEKMIKKMKHIKNKNEYFVFFDWNSLFYYSELVKEIGFHGNFPEKRDRLLEINRNEAKSFVRKYYPNIKITEIHDFQSIEEARDFLEIKGNKIWVLKAGYYEAHTFVPTTNDSIRAKKQTIDMLETFKHDYEFSGFILEEKIPSVIEITPEKLYYKGIPIAISINIENKPFGSANLSMQTGCTADLVFPIDKQNRIHDIAFPPIVDELAREHKGLFFWDASLLINGETGEIYFGEFCPNRPWYNSFFSYLAQMPNIDYFFENIINYKNPFILGRVGTSLRLFNLHRNSENQKIQNDISVQFNENNANHIWLWDVYKKKGKIQTVGYDWEVALITGTGKSVHSAVSNMYNHVDNFFFPEVYYRPIDDFLSMSYSTSMLNRLKYAVENKYFSLPFSKPF